METESVDNHDYTEPDISLDEDVYGPATMEESTKISQQLDEQHELFYSVDQMGQRRRLLLKSSMKTQNLLSLVGSTPATRRASIILVNVRTKSRRIVSYNYTTWIKLWVTTKISLPMNV